MNNKQSKYHFSVIEKDWYKRRAPSHRPTVIDVSIDDFQTIENHICKMRVNFDDGSTKTLISRVIYNRLRKEWTVDGMEVAVRVTNLA